MAEESASPSDPLDPSATPQDASAAIPDAPAAEPAAAADAAPAINAAPDASPTIDAASIATGASADLIGENGVIDQAAIDELLKQANFEDPSALPPVSARGSVLRTVDGGLACDSQRHCNS